MPLVLFIVQREMFFLGPIYKLFPYEYTSLLLIYCILTLFSSDVVNIKYDKIGQLLNFSGRLMKFKTFLVCVKHYISGL